jgi:molybdate transport system permease protein
VTGWLSPGEWQAVRLSLDVALRWVAGSLLPAVAVAWLLARRRFAGRALVDALVLYVTHALDEVDALADHPI